MKTAITIIMTTTAFVLGFFLSSAIDTIPKDVGTASHMGRLELALKDYYDKYRRFPETLGNLVDEGLVDEPFHVCSR